MINPFQNTNITDQSPAPLPTKTFNEAITTPDDFAYRGASMSPISRTVQSANYVKGTTGWKLDSNGTKEFN